MQWAARISNALEENRFELFRQTIQPLQAGLDTGAHYELLLRMRDEQGTNGLARATSSSPRSATVSRRASIAG